MEDGQAKPLCLVMFSGTDDKLTAAAVLTVGAAVMGRPAGATLALAQAQGAITLFILMRDLLVESRGSRQRSGRRQYRTLNW